MDELESDRPISQSKEAPSNDQHNKQQRHFMNIRINADDQSSSKLIIYSSIIIITLILVSVLAEYAIPNSIITVDTSTSLKGTSLQGCNNNLVEINETIFCSSQKVPIKKGQYVNGVVKLNQFIALYLKVNPAIFDFVNELVTLSIVKIKRQMGTNSTFQLKFDQPLVKKQVSVKKQYSNQSDLYLDFVKSLDQGDELYWQIQVKLDSPLRQFGFSLQTKTINPQYSIFCIAIRIAFIGISFLFVIITTVKYFKAKALAIPQQHITLNLSYITLTYNDPFYAISILYPNIFTSVLSTIFYWNFIILLLIIWIYFLKRIRDEQPQVQKQLFKVKEVVLLVSFYLITYGYRIGSSIYQTFDRPLIDNHYKSNIYLSIMSLISFLAFVIAMLYIFNLYCSICQQRVDLIWRSKVFLSISFFFFVIVFYLFMIDAFEVFSYSPKKLIFSVTFTNIFSYYLQYLYYESRDGEEFFKAKESNNEASFIEFQDKEISIDLQKDHFEDFVGYGLSKIQGENQSTISYLGESLQHQGSKIVEIKKNQR